MTVKELKKLVNNIPEECDNQILFSRREDDRCLYPYYIVEAIGYSSNSLMYRIMPDFDSKQKYFYVDIY